MFNILDYGSICDTAAELEMIYIIKSVWNILRIATPIILIIWCMFDVLAMVISPADKVNQGSTIIRRMFSATFVFLAGLIINVVLGILGQTGITNLECWNEATKEMVDAKYQAEEEERKLQEDNHNKSDEESLESSKN